MLNRFRGWLTQVPAPSVPVIPERQAASIRRNIFVYNLIIFLVLVFLAWAYFQPEDQWWSIHGAVPAPLRGLPVYSFWFGALGGIVISLKGIYDHGPNDWQVQYNLWHVGRPLSGGIAGAVTYVLLLAVSGSAPVEPVVLAVAFILGTQERRFFNFLYEVARIIVQVPGEGQEGVLNVTEIHPEEATIGNKLTILGQGFNPGVTVRLGNANLQDVVVSRDGTTITGTVPTGSGKVDILVANPDGAARVASAAFTYLAPTAISQVDPPSVDFGNQQVNSPSAITTVTLRNQGTSDLTVRSVNLTGADASEFVIGADQCSGQQLASGATCAVDVRFEPTQMGSRHASLTFVDEAGTQDVPLSGTGT